MATNGVPWAVDQAVHTAETARMLAYQATNGKEGVAGPTDLKVTAVPGASVNIAPGGYACLNRYPGNPQQTYLGAADTITNLAVPNVGGTARSDAIVLRIDDPEYGGTIPSNRAVGPYDRFAVITGVSASLSDAAALGLTYPAILLARIDRAANATTVVSGDIKDKRKLVNPRTAEEVLMTQPQAGTPGQVLSSSSYGDFPSNWLPTVDVPEWATHYTLISHLSGLGAVGGSAVGNVRNHLGSAIGAAVGYDTTSVTDGNRVNALMSSQGALPAGAAGTTQVVKIQANRTSGVGNIRIQSGTTVMHEVRFFEKLV